jgi:hypothetical protein
MYVKELVEENIAYLPSVEEVSYRGLMAKSGARTCSHNAERDCTTVCTIDQDLAGFRGASRESSPRKSLSFGGSQAP